MQTEGSYGQRMRRPSIFKFVAHPLDNSRTLPRRVPLRSSPNSLGLSKSRPSRRKCPTKSEAHISTRAKWTRIFTMSSSEGRLPDRSHHVQYQNRLNNDPSSCVHVASNGQSPCP